MSGIKLLSVGLLLILIVFVPTFSVAVETSPLPTIELERSVHFFSPDGDDVLVGPGAYEVEAGENFLRLFPFIGEKPPAVLVEAKPVKHEENIVRPKVQTSLAEAEAEDYLALVLLLPDGQGLASVGSYSGVRKRFLGYVVSGAKWVGGKLVDAGSAILSACWEGSTNYTGTVRDSESGEAVKYVDIEFLKNGQVKSTTGTGSNGMFSKSVCGTNHQIRFKKSVYFPKTATPPIIPGIMNAPPFSIWTYEITKAHAVLYGTIRDRFTGALIDRCHRVDATLKAKGWQGISLPDVNGRSVKCSPYYAAILKPFNWRYWTEINTEATSKGYKSRSFYWRRTDNYIPRPYWIPQNLWLDPLTSFRGISTPPNTYTLLVANQRKPLAQSKMDQLAKEDLPKAIAYVKKQWPKGVQTPSKVSKNQWNTLRKEDRKRMQPLMEKEAANFKRKNAEAKKRARKKGMRPPQRGKN
jgi:hypothetical protein